MTEEEFFFFPKVANIFYEYNVGWPMPQYGALWITVSVGNICFELVHSASDQVFKAMVNSQPFIKLSWEVCASSEFGC